MAGSKVYLTGAGPGDHKLITVRGLELIQKADCIIYDHLINPRLFEFAGKNCKLIYAGKRPGAHTLSQGGINKLLVKASKRHRTVVRLKGGDPFIFGRGAEEALHLQNNGVDFEIVPGVTSAIAAPAYCGIPLTLRSANSTVGFVTGHEASSKKGSSVDWAALAKGLGTIVVLMGVKNLRFIAGKLIDGGKPGATPAAVIRWGTTLRQQTVTGTLSNISEKAKKSGVTPPAVTVIGEVVRERKALGWFEKRPLFGKKIIVTRARAQASILSGKLEDLGAEVIEVPTIEIAPLNADKAVKDALINDAYDWIFFTSQNGVMEFARILSRAGDDIRLLREARIAAIGSETANELLKIGIKADYVPRRFCAEEIIKHFKNKKLKGAKTLILRAREARDVLPEGLAEIGASVKVIPLYKTLIPRKNAAKLKRVLGGGVDMVTFTSSSTAENFVKLFGKGYRKALSGVKIASIGPVTSQALRKVKLKTDIEAENYTIDGLVEEIVRRA